MSILSDIGTKVGAEIKSTKDRVQTLEATGIGSISNGVRRILNFTTYGNVSTSSTAHTKMIESTVTFDTNNFNYIIEMSNGIDPSGNASSGGGANLQIRINNTAVISSGHRGYDMKQNSYFTELTISPLITTGFVGTFLVNGWMAAYSAGKTVTNHNNGGAGSSNAWTNDKVDLRVIELHK